MPNILSFVEYAQRRIHRPDEFNRISVPGHGVAAGPSCYFLYRSNYDLVFALLDFYYTGAAGSAIVYITDTNKPMLGGGRSISVAVPAGGIHIQTEILVRQQEQVYIENSAYPVIDNVIVTARIVRYDKKLMEV